MAEAKKAETAKAAHEAKIALEPVLIFISRATQRLYVRRGFGANLEVPLTIRNPDKPIGTHVLAAVARTDDGGSMNASRSAKFRADAGCTASPPDVVLGAARNMADWLRKSDLRRSVRNLSGRLRWLKLCVG